MKPETAAAIARRIGMYQAAPDVAPHALWWYDPGAVCCDEVDEDDPNGLANYLATGDRPLRVMEALKLFVQPGGGQTWMAVHFSGCADRDAEKFYTGKGDTPAAAIIACAAALEEGNE